LVLEFVGKGFAIDHFIPWSFVTHDLIWNLIPASRAANSSKSDSLPSFTHYLDLHIDAHYDSLQIIRRQVSSLDPKKKRSLDEIIDQYTTLARGSDIDALTMSRDQFRIKLKFELQIQADLAKRLKFPDGWVWRQN